MPNNNLITGLILAGGKSRRMGSDKAFIQWNNKYLIQYVFEALEPICHEILVSSNSLSERYDPYSLIQDRFADIGPIAGLESGLYHANHPHIVVASCDTPFVTTDLFRHLLLVHGDHEITVASHEGIDQPLIGIYQKAIHHKIYQAILADNNTPHAVIKSLHWQEVPISQHMNFYSRDLFLNLNQPEDFNLIMEAIHLKYFGVIGEITGTSQESLPPCNSLDELKEILLKKYPELSQRRFQYSVNQEICKHNAALSAGDEVALLPPFTGG